MAVNDCFKPVFCDNGDDEDDEGPAIFKRSSTSSKQNHLNSGSKKLSSHKHEEARDRPVPNSSSLNRESSSSQKNKVTSNVKSSTDKYSAATLNSRTSVPSQTKCSSKDVPTSGSTKGSNMSKTSAKVEYSGDSDDDMPLSSKWNSATGVRKSNSAKPEPVHRSSPEIKAKVEVADKMLLDKSCVKKEDSDDSGDELPLSVRLASSSTAVARNSSLGTVKINETSRPSLTPVQKNKAIVKNSSDDSDDRPLLVRLKPKSSAEEKSLASTQKANGSGKKEPNNDLKPANYLTPAQKNKAVVQDSSDDSEDERPLSSRLKSTSAEGKSLASKFKTNGSVMKEPSSELQPLKSSNKRSIGGTDNSTEPLLKKAKIADPSASGKVKIETAPKKERQEVDNDHIPIAQRIQKANSSNSMLKSIKKTTSSFKNNNKIKKTMKDSKYSKSLTVPPGSGGGQKWMTLVHNGVIFPPPYKAHGIKMLYNGQPVDLTPEQEEVATMFAVMKDTDYASKPKFIENFMNDWRQVLGKNHIIKKFELCDFTPIYEWHLKEKEKKKQMSSEEKKALKEEKLKQEEKYMWAIVDGVKEKVGNFRVEPPGLFRGRGEHPKMGKLKRRIRPRDITINVGKDAPVPECPIPGERWKEVKHDNTVTWLAFWNDPINPKEFKYVFLAASSSLKGQSDKEKYEKARLLKDYIHGIRATYTKDFTSKDPTKRQIAVATYLIDKLALRAGNEKDDDEADTVGCCTLKVENVLCVPPNKLQFDFLGKDSIRYFNTVEVEFPVYKAIGEFQTAKKSDGKKKDGGDDLFDMLDTSKLNAHLKELMPGLTAKVFRTYNASITLDDMLNRETKDGTLPEKIAVYQRANKEVAIICNHQRSVSKSHDAQMSRLNEKIDELKAQREELKVDLSRARKGKPTLKAKKNLSPEVLEKKLNQIDAKIEKMELDKKIKDDLKTVALGTSKINYLDPRISVAWCKRHEVPIEKIFNKSLLSKFAWAMDVDPSYRF